MKILISVDIEGVAGVVHPEQTRPGHPEHERARRLMTAEANAAVAGALAGGATEVLVNDAHADYRNLLPDELHPAARLIQGKPRGLGMMAGVDTGCAAAFLVGYHAGAGARGTLAHTINSFAFARVAIAGRDVGEAVLCAAVAGECGVPVGLITGDDAFVAETRASLPEAAAVVVKDALGQRAAAALAPRAACEAIAAGAREAVRRIPGLAPLRLPAPLAVSVEATSPALADLFALPPFVRRVAATTIQFDASSATEAVRLLNTLSAMSYVLR
jgi:D-amino peptidase